MNSDNKIIQETRGWNEAKGVTVSQRSKESAHDYRYFPDPDLPNIYINDNLLVDLKSTIPELKKDRVKYLTAEYSLNEQVIQLLASDNFLYEYFKALYTLNQNQKNNFSDQELANWITEEILKILDSNNMKTDEIQNSFKYEYVLELIELTDSKTINRNSAREILPL